MAKIYKKSPMVSLAPWILTLKSGHNICDLLYSIHAEVRLRLA